MVPAPERRLLQDALLRATVLVAIGQDTGGTYVREHVPQHWDFAWKKHFVRHGDGEGGWAFREARLRFLPRCNGSRVIGFGLAAMDNGELVVMGTCREDDNSVVWAGNQEHTMIAFSEDRGTSWSDYSKVKQCSGRPAMLAYLGNGVLSFIGAWEQKSYRYFSSDFGRSWEERVPVQPASNGGYWGTEGNPLIDRDENGVAVRIAEAGYNFVEGPFPENPTCEFFRWSTNGGRTWTDEVMPPTWRWQRSFEGKTYTRGVSEGGLARAHNGWIVAALRTDTLPEHIPLHYDNYEGIAVSISKDDGKRWSPLRRLFDAGRHHPNLVCLPNGDLVMTYIVRSDIVGGDLASYAHGCEAIVSHDSGLSWDTAARYVLDEFAYFDEVNLTVTGHLYSVVLDDGSVLTTYGNYITGSPLILWKPLV